MPTQSDLHFRLEGDAGNTFDVVRFTLTEGLSQLFKLELQLSSSDENIDPAHWLDHDLTLIIQQSGRDTRAVRGVVTFCEAGTTGARRTRYRMTVEPALARLRLWHGSRIHQLQDVPDLLGQRMKERGVTAQWQLSRPHPVREYCVQHRETDFQFFARVAAEEGLAWYFVPGQDMALNLSDALQGGPGLSVPVRYVPQGGGDAAEPHLWTFAIRRQLAPSSTVQRDYTFRNPLYNLEHRAQAQASAHAEHYDAPGRYKSDEAGSAFTRSKLLALRNRAHVAHLAGDDARLWPGVAFDVEGELAPAHARAWRITEMVHHGEQAASQEEDAAAAPQGTRYAFEACAIPANEHWQGDPLPRPIMDGPQIAHVVGPPNEQLHTDEHGRVMVWFPWDRSGPRENATCWIRVSQGWAGTAFGMMLLPRVGHEVLVSFLDGDPDQPLVTGRAYHAANRPPYPLPAHAAVSTLKSSEHKGRGHNELLIDDTLGELKAQLQSSHASSQLNLGFLTHPRDRAGIGQPRGEGFELRTDASGAVRAATGLLLTAYERRQATGAQLDVAELVRCVQTLNELAATLTQSASEHQAPAADRKPQDSLLASLQSLGGGANDRRDHPVGPPIVAMGAPDGVVVATPKSIQVGAGEQLDAIAQNDLRLSAGQQIQLTSGRSLSLFAFGGGLHQIAHRDDLLMQAQHGDVQVQAAQTARTSARQTVLQAENRLTLLCGGAYLTLEGGNIEMGCPGTFTVRAEMKFTGSASASAAMNTWKQADFNEAFAAFLPDGEPARNRRYEILRADGTRIPGITDAQGLLRLEQGLSPEGLHIEWLQDEGTQA